MIKLVNKAYDKWEDWTITPEADLYMKYMQRMTVGLWVVAIVLMVI